MPRIMKHVFVCTVQQFSLFRALQIEIQKSSLSASCHSTLNGFCVNNHLVIYGGLDFLLQSINGITNFNNLNIYLNVLKRRYRKGPNL